MITANNGATKIAGCNIDIILEFNSIIDALQEKNPEIVLGAISAWSDMLEEKVDSIDSKILCLVAEISKDYIETTGERR